jgi:hypothetical protein
MCGLFHLNLVKCHFTRRLDLWINHDEPSLLSEINALDFHAIV